MVGNTRVITALRLAATGGITALGVAATYYPHNMWIPAAIAAAGAVGIHVIPSIEQKGITMSETPLTGTQLMGIAAPVAAAVAPVEAAVAPAVPSVETAVEAVDTAVKAPDTENVETAVADAVTAGEQVVKVAPDAAQALRDAADALKKIAESLL